MQKLFVLVLLLLCASCSSIKDEKVTPENIQVLVEKAMKGDELTKAEKQGLEAGVSRLIVPTIHIESSSGVNMIRVDKEARQRALSGKTINDVILIGQERIREREMGR